MDNSDVYQFGIFDVSLLVNRIFYAQTANNPTTVEKLFKASLKAMKRIKTDMKIKKCFYCFDAPNNVRKLIYPLYKANRPEKDPVLAETLEILYDFFNNGLGLTCFKKEGHEADDFVASVRKQITMGHKTIILSADKDLLQLIDDECEMALGVGSTRYDLTNVASIRNKFGIEPRDISTYLALMGDKADNFPGVEGCGEKTAVKLIKEFGDYNSIIANVENISNKRIKKNILEMDDKYLPKKLADLVYDIDLSCCSSNKNLEIKNFYMQKFNLDYAAKKKYNTSNSMRMR
jgi:DNA polymerase-1